MTHALLHPWSHGFMQRALLELLLVGVLGAVLGCWIVLYRLAYSAESLAHALFPGLVVAALIGAPLLAGAAGGVLLAAASVALATRLPGISRDVAVAVVVTTLFGLGALLALAPASPPGLGGLLFGDLLGVSRGDLVAAGVLTALSLVALGALHRPLLAAGFDRASATSLRVRPLAVDLALLALVAAAVVVGVQGLGNLLVLASLIGPAACARLVGRRVPRMMLVAVAVAVVCAVGGLYVSYYASVAAGASVAGTTVAAYLVLLTLSPLTFRDRWRGRRGRISPRVAGHRGLVRRRAGSGSSVHTGVRRC
ncbi:MAG TPA: metal ABC transporter permease [Gaiellaceae bacterium]